MPQHSPPREKKPVRLAVSREEASARIMAQIAEGEAFLPAASQSVTSDDLFTNRRSWVDYTVELLKRLFTTDDLAQEFASAQNIYGSLHSRRVDRFQLAVNDTKRQIEALKSIHRRLEFFEGQGTDPSVAAKPAAKDTRNVFVVHGRDEGAKQVVARFLEKLQLKPIILHELPDSGRTVIEKFERHADVAFAVVLLTPDDEGRRLSGGEELKPRARQNVVLELGYFIGKLGREKVCPLKVRSVEEPSDLHGVLYVPFDEGGAWRLTLARELKAAGMDVDLNLAV